MKGANALKDCGQEIRVLTPLSHLLYLFIYYIYLSENVAHSVNGFSKVLNIRID
jgi:hypothetical protein